MGVPILLTRIIPLHDQNDGQTTLRHVPRPCALRDRRSAQLPAVERRLQALELQDTATWSWNWLSDRMTECVSCRLPGTISPRPRSLPSAHYACALSRYRIPMTRDLYTRKVHTAARLPQLSAAKPESCNGRGSILRLCPTSHCLELLWRRPRSQYGRGEQACFSQYVKNTDHYLRFSSLPQRGIQLNVTMLQHLMAISYKCIESRTVLSMQVNLSSLFQAICVMGYMCLFIFL